MDLVAIQAAIATVMPFIISALKALLPTLDGRAGIIANVVLTILTILGYAAATGEPMVVAGITGLGFGMAGSKGFDVAKHGLDPIKYRRPEK